MVKVSKHKYIYDFLKAEIIDGRLSVGSCLPTELELAARFTASRQTVLKALDSLKKDGLLTSSRGRGTFVASNLEQKRTLQKQLGFVGLDMRTSFGHEVFIGFESEAIKQGYSVVVGNSNFNTEKEALHIKKMYEQGVMGVAIVPFFQGNRELVRSYLNMGFPIVCIDNNYDITDVPFVHTDNFLATYKAVSFLISTGRKKIGFITNTIDSFNQNCVANDRYMGYRKALSDHKIEFDPYWVQEVGVALANRSAVEVGLDIYAYAPVHKLLAGHNRPDAIFLLWDELAPSTYNAIFNSNLRIPEDISVIGFNDDNVCSVLKPTLSSIRQPSADVGILAASKLIALVEGREIVKEEVLHNELIIRGSTISIQ